VGSSLAGLMAGIMLKRQGHDVHNIEQASSSDREGQAAGLGLAGHMGTFLKQHDRLHHVPLGVTNHELQFLNPRTLQKTSSMPYAGQMTVSCPVMSW
jgi:2-polyprenyl-6-methoxyphenol hydroxylase-like FAD-dependent oxidoreductase